MNNKKKYLLPLLVLFFISGTCYAQKGFEDVVYLKNGWILRGAILEFIPNQSIKIQTGNKTIFVFKSEEIVKIAKEKALLTKSDSLIRAARFKKIRFVTMIEQVFSIGNGSVVFRPGPKSSGILDNWSYSYPNYLSPVGIKTINGIQLKGRLFLGAGIGIDLHHQTNLANNLSDIPNIPVTFEARFNVLKTSISPTINSSIGYLFGEDYGHKGGLIFNPSVGLKIYIYKNYTFFINLGYKVEYHTIIQSHGGYGPGYPDYYISQGYLKFYTGSIGVSF